jgi:transposase
LPKIVPDLTILRASQPELEAALATERRKSVRKRLIAMCGLLHGKSICEAAADAKVDGRSVERWIARLRQAGFRSLLHDDRHGHPKWRINDDQVAEIRREIAAALTEPLRPAVRTRLLAIDIVFSCQPIEEAAASVRVDPNAVRTWLRLVARDGFAPTLARWQSVRRPRRHPIDADPALLRELAANETRRPVRKQILALALVAEGMSPHAAALRAGAHYAAVLRRSRRFQKEGIAAFRDKPHYGWARKLTVTQIQELRDELSRHPGANYPQLQHFILTRFGVQYSVEGLRLLLKRDLRIVWGKGRFTQAPPQMAPEEHLDQRLDLADLRTALATTHSSHTRRKLVALIQLAQGWEADRVAFQVGVEPETLQRWVDLYCRFGIAALDRRPPVRSLQPPSLPPEQHSALTHWIAFHPDIGDAALCARLNVQFGAEYDRSIIRSVAAEIRTEIAASPKQPS